MMQTSLDTNYQVKQMPSMRTLSIRARCRPSDLGSSLRTRLCEVFDHVLATGALQAGPPYMRFLSRSADEYEIEVGYPVCDFAPWSSHVKVGEIPACTAVVAEYVGGGPCEHDDFESCADWIREQGKSLSAPPVQFFCNDPRYEPDPAKWKTAVVWPIEDPAEARLSKYSLH